MGLRLVAFYKLTVSSERLEKTPATRQAPCTASKLLDSVPSFLQAYAAIDMLSRFFLGP